MADPEEEDPICMDCGHPKSEHGIDQYSGRQVKCPIRRQEKHTPPQEPNTVPRGDY